MLFDMLSSAQIRFVLFYAVFYSKTNTLICKPDPYTWASSSRPSSGLCCVSARLFWGLRIKLEFCQQWAPLIASSIGNEIECAIKKNLMKCKFKPHHI